ncbi:MAG: sigma 54-interacting transcriptional regulator, partial [Planctomycetes bacterium]|nr:sigma 54-interacting transcriptional regulator [Planctomycetota bacterium]
MFLASLSFMLAYTVGILRYRLMLVDQVLSKGMMYYVLTSGLTVAFSLAVGLGMLLPQFLNISPSPQQALTVVAVLVLGVMLLLWLRDRFQQGIDRQYFREKYQLDKALQRMNLAVSHPAEPEALAEMMLGSCRDVLEVEQAALYLRATPHGPFQLVAAEGAEDVPLQFHADDEFLEALKQSGSLQRVTPGTRSEMSMIQNSLRELKADLVCALEGEAALDGMVTLGKKINSSPYSAEDLTFLNALGQITYVAFRSAKVDREIRQLNEELQEKIEKITNQQRQIIVLQSELSSAQNGFEPKHLLSEKRDDDFRHDSIKGNSPAMQKFLVMVRKVAESESSVVIRGESGTGKELLAQLLHDNS